MLAESNHIIHKDCSQETISFPLKPYQLVSLWDMLRFYADRFLRINHALDILRSMFSAVGLRDGDFSEEGAERIGLVAMLKSLHAMLSELNLQMSALQAMNIIECLEYTDVDKRICDKILDLYKRMQDEFENQLFFMVPSDKTKFYESGATFFSKEVLDKFPNLIYDIDEACKCYAFGRSTACVFHLMRVMECAVQKLGDLLGVRSPDEKLWQTIIGDIRKVIEVKYPDRKQAERIKYENILAHLETIKIAWRNPTMHPKNTYTEEEAEGIIRAVKILLADLTKLF